MAALQGPEISKQERKVCSMTEGPPIEELTRHLAECPPNFLAEPMQDNGTGEVHVAAVVQDLMIMMDGQPLGKRELAKLRYKSASSVKDERNRLRLTLIASWLAFNSQFKEVANAQKLRGTLLKDLAGIAKLLPAERFVSEPDRREELARILLAGSGLLPAGESAEEAENRFDALSTVKRDAVVKAAKAAEKRARKLREEMARKERERRAASVYGHE